jgi:hypothetical protein
MQTLAGARWRGPSSERARRHLVVEGYRNAAFLGPVALPIPK